MALYEAGNRLFQHAGERAKQAVFRVKAGQSAGKYVHFLTLILWVQMGQVGVRDDGLPGCFKAGIFYIYRKHNPCHLIRRLNRGVGGVGQNRAPTLNQRGRSD
jgi:hypothetical protein